MADNRDRLVSLVSTRTVQTNEVRRCTALLPAFTAVRDRSLPLGLIEIGAAAGLNLRFDRYRYDYGTVATGADRSPLTLTCEVRHGGPPIPPAMPEVASRLGLDLHPIDPADEDGVRWARSLLWPEQVERVHRFETAMAMARDDPPPILAGDALELLPDAIAHVPVDASLVVYHSFVLNQWDAGARARLDGVLRAASTERRIDRIAIELLARGRTYPSMDHTRYERGVGEERHLATVHHHGEWIRWES